MKVFKHRNLMSLLYAILLAIPFISIAVRCIYVQSNKNAFESYSDAYVQKFNPITSITNYINNEQYYVNNLNVNTTTVYDIAVLYKSISIDVYSTFGFDTSREVVGFQMIQYNSSGGFYTIDYYLNDGVLTKGGQHWSGLGKTLKEFTFVADTTLNATSSYWKLSGSAQVNQLIMVQDKLDNVFEFSLKEITDNQNFGNLNFFQWFTNMFIDSSKANNQLYVGFINWYLNYTLFVSLGYILFLVIMWFIKLVRQILEKGLSFGSGGSY